MTKVMGCGLEVNEFYLKTRYYVHKPPYPPGYGLYIMSLQFFSNDGFGIKYSRKKANQCQYIRLINFWYSNVVYYFKFDFTVS